MRMLRTSVDIRVRYAETDAMGVVYHGNYLPWFEIARIALLEKAHLSYRELDAQGFLLPVLEAQLKYIAPARFDDVVTVTATMAELPRVRIHIDYEVSIAGKVITRGHTTHAFMNREAQAIKPPPVVNERLAAAFDKAASHHR
jgi:acyl-CoA thioester hydrolase